MVFLLFLLLLGPDRSLAHDGLLLGTAQRRVDVARRGGIVAAIDVLNDAGDDGAWDRGDWRRGGDRGAKVVGVVIVALWG